MDFITPKKTENSSFKPKKEEFNTEEKEILKICGINEDQESEKITKIEKKQVSSKKTYEIISNQKIKKMNIILKN